MKAKYMLDCLLSDRASVVLRVTHTVSLRRALMVVYLYIVAAEKVGVYGMGKLLLTFGGAKMVMSSFWLKTAVTRQFLSFVPRPRLVRLFDSLVRGLVLGASLYHRALLSTFLCAVIRQNGGLLDSAAWNAGSCC